MGKTLEEMSCTCGNSECSRILVSKQRLSCSRCKSIVYCSKECQILCWPNHKISCNLFKSDKTKSEKKIKQKFLNNAANIFSRVDVVMDFYKNKQWDKVTDLEHDIVRIVNEVNEINEMDKGFVKMSMAASELFRLLSYSCKMIFKIEKAIEFAEMAKKEYERKKIANSILKVSCYMQLANCYTIVGRVKETKELYEQILPYHNNDDEKYSILFGIGMCNFRLCEYELAIQNLEEAYVIAIKNMSENKRLEVMLRLSQTYFSQRKYGKACKSYSECINLSGSLSEGTESTYTLQFVLHVIIKSTLGIGVSKWANARERSIIAIKKHKSHTTEKYKKEIQKCHILMHESNEFLMQASDIVENTIKNSKVPLCKKLISDINIRNAYLNYDMENRDNALVHLRKFLDSELENARDACKFCGEKRSETMEMLTCSGCKVARFCNTNCQQQASKKKMMCCGDIIVMHKFVCPLLKNWKQFKKTKQDIKSLCNSEHLHFLHKCHALFFVHKDLCADHWTK